MASIKRWSGTGVVIAAAARTPIGSYGKSLKEVPASDLGALAARAAIERAGLSPEQIDHVVFGNVIHTAPEDMYMARVVGMKAGVPKETPAFTVNRLCGTGVQAIASAAQAIQCGDVEVALAGGTESMSRAVLVPFESVGSADGEVPLVDAVIGCLTDPFHDIAMGVTAENLADDMGITRREQDEFAVESHRRAVAAQAKGRFDAEICPVPLRVEGTERSFERDEHVRADLTVEAIGKLGPAFRPDGAR